MSTGETNTQQSQPNPARPWWDFCVTQCARNATDLGRDRVGRLPHDLATSRRTDEIQQRISSTQSSLKELDHRLRQGDSGAIAELEGMRYRQHKLVAIFLRDPF